MAQWTPFALIIAIVPALSACVTSPQIVVDANSIGNQTRYAQDKEECTQLAKSYDRNNESAANAAVGAGTGAASVASVAKVSSIIAGAVHPAIPFVVVGAAARPRLPE